MKPREEINVHEAVRDQVRVQRAMRDAVQDAIRTHKLLGHPIVVWRDGKVVIVPAEEIELNEMGTDGTHADDGK